MDYTLAPLYVRIVFFILIGAAAAAIMCIELKKRTVAVRITVGIVVSVILVVFSGSPVYSAIHPKIETFTGTYVGWERGNTMNPMSDDRIFERDGEKIYIEFDFITRNLVCPEGFEEGKTYTVTYETRENLIVAVAEAE